MIQIDYSHWLSLHSQLFGDLNSYLLPITINNSNHGMYAVYTVLLWLIITHDQNRQTQIGKKHEELETDFFENIHFHYYLLKKKYFRSIEMKIHLMYIMCMRKQNMNNVTKKLYDNSTSE